MGYLTFALVVLILLAGAALGAFYAVIRRGVTVNVDAANLRVDAITTVDMSQAIPAMVTLRVQQMPPVTDGVIDPAPAPFPREILDYIDQESEEHARVSRKKRARALHAEVGGDWDLVLKMLQREDNPDA